MNFKRKLLVFFSILLFIAPISTYAYSSKVLLGGQNIGIEVNTKGIIVVGLYKVNDAYIGKEAGIMIGDKIVKIADTPVNSIDEMINAIDKNIDNSKVNMTISRDNVLKNVKLDLVRDNNDVYKTGLYVKDQITGIGTLTYIDPETKIYGALGHEIIESNTKEKIEIKDGKIFNSKITGTIKSDNESTGEKNAIFDKNTVYGTIEENTINGIFGKYTGEINNDKLIDIASVKDITLGEAEILTVLKDDVIETFKINILKINTDSKTKNILFEITDEKLIDKTNGVIKGMSGSPIVQNNKLIGAVTHAIVNDNEKGYGIFITTMLEEGEN